jgi:hypothetical protein
MGTRLNVLVPILCTNFVESRLRELRRITPPRTPVHKGKKESRSPKAPTWYSTVGR